MANLARTNNVFDRLFDFRRDFDDLFSGMLADSNQKGRPGSSLIVAVPPIEAWVDPNDKTYHLSIALAGVDPQEVRLNLQGNTLTVSGEHQTGRKEKMRTTCSGNCPTSSSPERSLFLRKSIRNS